MLIWFSVSTSKGLHQTKTCKLCKFNFEFRGSDREIYLNLHSLYGRPNFPSEQVVRINMDFVSLSHTLIHNTHP